jgi:acyl carrier protein
MNREEVLTLVREHLAEELEVDIERISEGTRFKEDLDADSLDLYSLVQELEDTYGVRMSDEQAARIRTVGQAVDFVISETSTRLPGGETSDPGTSAGEDTATGTTANREPGP